MESKLKFDLDGSNEPVIVAAINYESEDLRDKVANRFFNALWGSFPIADEQEQEVSQLCFVEFLGISPGKQDYQLMAIHPGREDKFINRLQMRQARRIIPLAFQMFDGSERRKLIEELTTLDGSMLNEEKGRLDKVK